MRAVSPLYHANGTVPINTGFPVWHHLLLAAVCAVLAVLAVRLFDRRDVIVLTASSSPCADRTNREHVPVEAAESNVAKVPTVSGPGARPLEGGS